QAGGRRLHAHELVGGLGAVAQGQFGVDVEVGGLLDPGEDLLDGQLSQGVAGPPGQAHVLGDQRGVGPADLGQHLPAVEVDDLVDLDALVGLAPAEDGDVQHGESPSWAGAWGRAAQYGIRAYLAATSSSMKPMRMNFFSLPQRTKVASSLNFLT